MFKHIPFILTAVLIAAAAPIGAQGGLFTSLRDKVTGRDEQPTAQQGPPPQAQPELSPQEQDKARQQAESQARRVASKMTWDKVPGNLFRQYAGKWEGNFWVYGNDGRKRQVQKVTVQYAPQRDGTMHMESFNFDLVSKQWVTSEKAIYTVSGDTVTVTVSTMTGKSHTQMGHYSDGQLFLKSNIKDGIEHFRERVRGNELLIDGYGVYGSVKGDDHNVFIGRLKRTN